MSAEHFILAGIFAVLFIVPLVWLFLVDGSRPEAGQIDPTPFDAPSTAAGPRAAD